MRKMEYKILGALVLLAYSSAILVFIVYNILKHYWSDAFYLYTCSFEQSALQLVLHTLYAFGAFCLVARLRIRPRYVILAGALGFLTLLVLDIFLVSTYRVMFYVLYALFHVAVIVFFSGRTLKRVALVAVLILVWILVALIANSFLGSEFVI
jgi:hypothetical protein